MPESTNAVMVINGEAAYANPLAKAQNGNPAGLEAHRSGMIALPAQAEAFLMAGDLFFYGRQPGRVEEMKIWVQRYARKIDDLERYQVDKEVLYSGQEVLDSLQEIVKFSIPSKQIGYSGRPKQLSISCAICLRRLVRP